MNITPVFKLLSDESRLRVILLLATEKLCVCELVGILDIPQPKISKILSKLRDMNLVDDERIEKFVFYTLKNNNLILNNTLSFITTHLTEYPQIKTDLDRLDDKDKFINACSLASLKEITE